MPSRILFVCKKRVNAYGNSIGLLNSASFVAQALVNRGIDAKVVCVDDNNQIDREVYCYKPTHVVIEALWVVPSKFRELLRLHKNRQWYVRIHSKLPFLSMEGIAMEWIKEYQDIIRQFPNLHIAANSNMMSNDLSQVFDIDCVNMPNICPIYNGIWKLFKSGFYSKHNFSWINIGCFGAIRPLKNTLIQAFAAIEFADSIGKLLRFHINGNRSEQRGEETLKNLKALFPIRGHHLITHDWMNHDSFLNLVRAMDIGLQVSFSESFNIVASDFVSQNIPIVGSPDIEWLDELYQAETNSVQSIVRHMRIAWFGRRISLQTLNLLWLKKHNEKSINRWMEELTAYEDKSLH